MEIADAMKTTILKMNNDVMIYSGILKTISWNNSSYLLHSR